MTDAERIDWLEAQARAGQLMALEICNSAIEMMIGQPGSQIHVRRNSLRDLIDAAAELTNWNDPEKEL
jgi:diacylglycerol kinase